MRGTVVKMKKKNHWKNICALSFAFCMVFSTVAGDASFVTAYAAEVQTAAGSEAAENPSPAEESGADSTEGAQNTINQESAAQTGNAGQTDAAQTEDAVQTDAAQTDGAAQADAVQNTESGADQNTALIQTAGAESLAAFSYTAAPEAGLPAAATAGSGTLDVSGVSYSGFSKGIAAKGWSEGTGFTVAVNAAGYTDLKFSADMRSSGTGPANFALEYSIDGASWTKISGTDVTLSTGLASVYQQTALPAALSGKAFTLRVTMQGNTSVNQSTVGTNGVTSINNIVVTGTQGEAATDGTVCSKVKASVEPGDVEAGTKVELSCATEGATITYHTDLDSADKTYTEALVIEEDVTIYATAELEGYETSETAEFAYAVKQGAKSKEAALATTLSDGNMVALYYENNGTGSVLSQTASGKKLKGVSATAADGALAIPEDAAELTVSVDENGYYTFTCGGKYLTSGATGSSVTFADAAGDYSLWKLQKANENGGYYVINANAKYNNTTEQYLEYYSGFTTYSYKSSSDAAYVFYFYLIDEGTPSVHIRADESVTENVAQWSGTADYKTAGVTADTGIAGDSLNANDLLDADAIYSAVVNGTAVAPYTEATSTSTGSTSYYMGGKGIGSGSNDYAQFVMPTTGYANMVLAFRLRASNTGAGSFQMQYSTDGVDFKNLSTGTYAYKYTKYVGGEPQEVSAAEKITDGVAKTSLAPANYISFTFDIPNEAANADRLYIRMVPGSLSAKGDKAPAAGGVIRMDTVTVTGNPLIASDLCGYVAAEPQSGVVAVGSELTLTSATEGVTIHYSVNGGAEQIYDASAKPKLADLPAVVTAYATKDGYKDSIRRTFSYQQAQVATVKATPNGGSVVKNTAVNLTCETEGATIQYSADDGATWQDYTEKLALTELPVTYKVKAVKDGYLDSSVLTLSFTERTNEKYQIYFGQLHSHTSYSDGAGSCEDAYQHATNVDNLDFVAVTDHSNSFDNADSASISDGSMSEEWKEGHALATQYTTSGFVCIYGFEMTWSNGLGHINTFNTEGFQSRTQNEYKTYSTALQNYYATLKTQPDSISQFNHPGTTFGDFSDFAYYDEEIDKLITTIEVGNGEGAIGSSGYFPSYEYYQRALDKGWHLAPTNNQDNHKGLWGDANTARSVVLVDSLTQENIYDAMRNYRVYATEDNDLSIYYTLDGYIMGSILEDGATGDTVHLSVDLSDPTDASIGKVQVITNGGLVLAEKNVSGNEETVTFDVKNDYSYYYIKVVEADSDIAVTAPVWVGSVEAAGIDSFSTDEVLPVRGEPLTVNLGLYNNENSELAIDSITFEVGGETVHEADLAAAGLGSVASMSTGSYSFDYTYDGVGSMEMTAVVHATMNGVQKVYKSVLKLSYATPEMVTKVIIDGTHYNDYVTGYYGGNVGNFTAIAGAKNVKVEVVTDEITPEMLANCALLVISAPAKKSGTANAGDYTVSHFEDSFIQMVKDYTDNGGTLITCGIADYQDSTSGQTATEMNKLLAAIGASTRLNSDEAYDETNNGGQPYRLYLKGTYNKDSRYLRGASEEQEYSAYSGCTVALDADAVTAGRAEALVSGYDTTYSIDCKDDAGNRVTGSPTYVEKGNMVALAHETLGSGANVFVAGNVFISDFEVKAELDNIWDLPYLNRTIAENILDEVKVELPLSTIAEVRKNGTAGDVYRVEGYVTAGTAVEGNTFFDTIYIQDDTAGIDIFPYAESGLAIGTKVEITGYVDAYQGDKELKVISSRILDEEPKVIAPEKLSAKDAMDYEKSGGKLVQVEGTVTDVLYDAAGTGVSQFWLDDGSGVNANIFIDGYILSATTGKNELASVVSTGKRVSAVGVVYAHPEGTSDEAVTCLRVRNCDEIVEVTSGEMPDDTETPGNTETPDTETPGDTGSSDSGTDSADGNGNGGSVSGSVTVSDGQTTDAVTVASQNDWDPVRNRVTAASAGSTVTVLLADGVSVPGDVIAAVRGRDVRLVFRLANGIVWTIDGRNVTSDTVPDMDFGVTINSHAVPDALARQTAAGRDYFQISLNHDGAFGFTAVMTLPVGTQYAGMYAKLYYYNEAKGRLELASSGKVDANGNVELTFVHASDYVVVLDQMPAVQTGDDTPLAVAVMMLLAGMVLLAAAARKKRIFLK